MDEETKSKDQKVIKLTQEQYLAIERALQWPEDLQKYDQSNKTTNLAEILGNLTSI